MTTRREVFLKLQNTKKLPTPSKTTLEVIRLCRSETASLNDIAGIIQTDPALSAELLKYANAAFLATGVQVVSIQRATVKLGMQTVVNLAIGFSLLSRNKQGKCSNFNYGKFWSTALLQAIAAKTIAGLVKEFDPEELFICALLSHMGELALASLYPEAYATVIADEPSDLIRKTMEKDEFEIDSSELTVELFLDWGLPAHFALAAGFHNDLDYAELGLGTTLMIAKLLNISYAIARFCHQSQHSKDQIEALEKEALQFGIKLADSESLFDRIIKQWQELGQIFNIRTRPCLPYEDILAGKGM